MVVLGVERKTLQKLQESRTIRKIATIDERIVCAFSGLTADARVLINRARIESQSYSLSYDDAPTVEYMTRWIATKQQVWCGGVGWTMIVGWR